MRLILARHGQTDWNKQRRIQGRSDIELNEVGRSQVEMLSQALRGEQVSAIYSSPLKRARYTAEAIARFHDTPAVTLQGLQEIDAGQVDGMTYEEMDRHHSEFLAKWVEDCSSVAPPGGCSLPQLQDEVWEAIQYICFRHAGRSGYGRTSERETVVAVAHFFPIVIAVCRVLGLPLSECRRLKLEVASITRLNFNEDVTVLSSWNDTCHLRR